MVGDRLAGSVGLVTGGAGPLGTALTRGFVDQGATVFVLDLEHAIDRLQCSAGAPQAHYIACDLVDPESLDLALEVVRDRLGVDRLDFLVNNAAFTGSSALSGYSCSFDEQTDEAFDRAMALNLSVPFRISRRLAPALRRSGNGVILNISSIYGLVGPDLRLYEGTGMGNPAAYAASKGGLVQLTRYLATVLAPSVRVNCIALGGIQRGQEETFVDRYVARTPLGRMATEEDAVGAAIWLTSSDAAYVTGQVVAVDGGWTSW